MTTKPKKPKKLSAKQVRAIQQKAAKQQRDAFVEQRRDALMSMERAQIEAWARAHRIAGLLITMDRPDDTEFWRVAHTIRAALTEFGPELRRASAGWLHERGFAVYGIDDLQKGN